MGLTEVNVEVIVSGVPSNVTVPASSISPSPVALPPSPPQASSKSAGVPIGAVAGGIAGGVVVIGKLLCLTVEELSLLLCLVSHFLCIVSGTTLVLG